jgi:hypothetical protein
MSDIVKGSDDDVRWIHDGADNVQMFSLQIALLRETAPSCAGSPLVRRRFLTALTLALEACAGSVGHHQRSP